MTMQTISETMTRPDASSTRPTTYLKLARLDNGKLLRFEIKGDSYAFQCHARVETWLPAGWSEVWAIPGESLGISNRSKNAAFERWAQELATVAAHIVD